MDIRNRRSVDLLTQPVGELVRGIKRARNFYSNSRLKAAASNLVANNTDELISSLLATVTLTWDVTNIIYEIPFSITVKYFPASLWVLDFRAEGLTHYPSARKDSKTFRILNGVPVIIETKMNLADRDSIFITFPKTKNDEQRIRQFIDWLWAMGKKEKRRKAKFSRHVVNPSGGFIQDSMNDTRFRSFDDVFIPEKLEVLLKKSLCKFKHSEDWYVKHHINYHYGMILYGPPGTGKSCLIEAIADFMNADLVTMTADNIAFIGNTLRDAHGSKGSKFLIVGIEDIDACNAVTREQQIRFQDDDMRFGISSLLNYMDGPLAPSNVIYILTTNHLENIDPAIYRPGRCDIAVEIPYVNTETFKKFLKSFYDVDDVGNIEVKRENVSFATLQNMAMVGDSAESVIKYMQTPD